MGFSHNTCPVCRITLGDGNVYYYCSSTRMAGVTLDGTTYSPFILAVGDRESIGNFGEGSAIGKTSMTLLLGQKQYQGTYNIDVSLAWNNATCQIKMMDVDTDTTWAGCDDYIKGIVKEFKIGTDTVNFSVEEANHKDSIVLPRYTPEDIVNADSNLAITDIPEDSVGQRIPMQYGNLNDVTLGIFAKGLLVSNKIGFQELRFDSENLASMTSIGMWEKGLKRYFAGKATGEYTIDTTTYKFVKFRADSTTTLAEDLAATTGIQTFSVADSSKLVWQTEGDYKDIDSYPEVLSINIIGIDNELMMLIEQPALNIVRVERGYGDTTEAVHASGATIYQCAAFSARNLMSFSETFYPVAVSNPYYYPGYSTYASITGGSFSDFVKADNTTYIQLAAQTDATPPPSPTDNNDYQCINFDLRFEKIEERFTCYGVYLLLKALFSGKCFTAIRLINAGASYNSSAPLIIDETYRTMITWGTGAFVASTDLVDTVSTPSRERVTGTHYQLSPAMLTDDEIFANCGGSLIRTVCDALSFSDLTGLNGTWKCNVRILQGYVDGENYVRLYRIGFLIDFFAAFTDKRVVSVLTGRKITADADTVLGTSLVGTTITTTVCTLLDILLTELGYATTDFDTTSWRASRTYRSNAAIDDTCYMSYGIDESEKGWDFCQLIASQHGLMLCKTNAGKIKLIDLYQLQDDGEYGYSSLTAYGISIDDILMPSGKKEIAIQQTGTDRIRNMVSIKYNRNNSTDEYQAIYPTVQSEMDSYVLKESGIALSTARTNYYGGQKTESLELECLSIYTEAEAQRLWQWHINDKSEVFFYAEISIPYFHYTDVNSKSAQYDIGDVIYLDGIYQGITYNSGHKWVIWNIVSSDQGRTIKLEAKSIEPISAF